MKRTAFTMIELIFVIVILGILASVAIPKLAAVQDDALVSTEEAGVGAMRTSVAAIHGSAILRGVTDFNVEVTTSTGLRAFSSMVQPAGGVGTPTLSSARYPSSLSLNATSGLAADGNATVATAESVNTVDTLGLVLDAGNRDQWTTGTPSVTGATAIELIGPASGTLVNGETQAQLDNAGSWAYSPINGSFVWRAANAYTAAAD